MATAADVTKLILGEILIRASESPLEADELQDTVLTMNNYMTAIDAGGISLGYTVVTDLGDDITIPNGALQGLIANVAIMVAPLFGAGAMVDQALIAKAKIGLDSMRKLANSLKPMALPSTLPIGSGNEGDFFDNEHFFPETTDNALTETNQNIGLESET